MRHSTLSANLAISVKEGPIIQPADISTGTFETSRDNVNKACDGIHFHDKQLFKSSMVTVRASEVASISADNNNVALGIDLKT